MTVPFDVVALVLTLASGEARAAEPCVHFEFSEDAQRMAEVCPVEPPTALVGKGGWLPFGTTPDWQNTIRRQVGSIRVRDIDNDGDLDAVIGCFNSNSFPPYDDWRNFIYRNVNGQLEATPSWFSSDQVSTGDIMVGDINLDGHLDVFAVNGQGGTPSVIYFGNATPGTPNVSPTWSSSISPSTWGTSGLLFDFDHDGDLDVLTTNQWVSPNPYRPLYMFRNHAGVLENTPSWQSTEHSIQNGAAVGDFDNDGWEDLATAKWVNFQAAIHKNLSGTLATTTMWSSGDPSGCRGAAVHDMDGNGLLDVFFGYDPTMLFSQTSPGNFAVTWTSAAASPSAQEIHLYDVDLDGDMDLGEINFSTGRCHIYLNDNGTLPTLPSWTYDAPVVGNAMDFGDINNDGRPDLVIGYSGNPSVVVFYGLPPRPECIGDVNNSGVIDIDDLVGIITHWGSSDPTYDVVPSGNVDIDDLVYVITHWGACP